MYTKKTHYVNLEIIVNHDYDDIDNKYTMIYHGDDSVPVVYVNVTDKDKCTGEENFLIALDYPSRHILYVRNVNLVNRYNFKLKIKVEKLFCLNKYLGTIDKFFNRMLKQEIICISKTTKTTKRKIKPSQLPTQNQT